MGRRKLAARKLIPFAIRRGGGSDGDWKVVPGPRVSLCERIGERKRTNNNANLLNKHKNSDRFQIQNVPTRSRHGACALETFPRSPCEIDRVTPKFKAQAVRRSPRGARKPNPSTQRSCFTAAHRRITNPLNNLSHFTQRIGGTDLTRAHYRCPCGAHWLGAKSQTPARDPRN